MSTTYLDRISKSDDEKKVAGYVRSERTARHAASQAIFNLEESLLNLQDSAEENKNSLNFDFNSGVSLRDKISKITSALESSKALRDELFPEGTSIEVHTT